MPKIKREPKEPNVGSQWKPGQSGNPLGGPKKMTVAQLARQHTPHVINRLVYWLNQDESPSASIRAGEILLDRAFGKAVQPIADGSDHEALELDLTNVSAERLASYERTMLRLLNHTHQIQEAVIDIADADVKVVGELTPDKYDGTA